MLHKCREWCGSRKIKCISGSITTHGPGCWWSSCSPPRTNLRAARCHSRQFPRLQHVFFWKIDLLGSLICLKLHGEEDGDIACQDTLPFIMPQRSLRNSDISLLPCQLFSNNLCITYNLKNTRGNKNKTLHYLAKLCGAKKKWGKCCIN